MIAKLFAITALVAALVAQTTNVTIDQVEQAFTAANIVPSGTFSTVLFRMYMRGSVHPVFIVIPTFNPTGLLDVVFFDNTTNVNVTVTPGQNLTRERKSAFKLSPMTLLTI